MVAAVPAVRKGGVPRGMVRAMRPFPVDLLRPGVPRQPSFTVAEVPCRAKLDQNESPFDLPPEIKQQIVADVESAAWNRYPQPRRYAEIKERFAAAIDQPAERVVLTAGCDQMILLSFWAAGGAGRLARLFEPTYPMFGYYAAITQTEADRVVLGADYDVAGALDRRPAADLLHLVSPNNPTGSGPDRETVLRALELGPACLVFLDEAYADYAGSTLVDLVEEWPQLLVGRSLSKSMLAGVRLGYGVGHPELIAVLERLLFVPYHLSALQLATAARFDRIRPLLEARVHSVTAERERVASRLRALGLRVWPSRANFLLFAVEDVGSAYSGLLARGVRVRNVSSMPGLSSHLRVTIGIAEENELFLESVAASV